MAVIGLVGVVLSIGAVVIAIAPVIDPPVLVVMGTSWVLTCMTNVYTPTGWGEIVWFSKRQTQFA